MVKQFYEMEMMKYNELIIEIVVENYFWRKNAILQTNKIK